MFFVSRAEVIAAPGVRSSQPETPTRIRSDIIDIKRKSQTMDFINNVVVEKDDSSLLANKMTVFYEEKKRPKPVKKVELPERKAGEILTPKEIEERDKKELAQEPVAQNPNEGTKIKRIDAKENVKIFSQEFIASGDSGYYDPKESIFVLEKNVIVNNGSSIASGNKFIYSLVTKKGHFVGKKDETSIAGNGGDRRVVVVIGDDSRDMKKSSKKPKKENLEIDEQDSKR